MDGCIPRRVGSFGFLRFATHGMSSWRDEKRDVLDMFPTRHKRMQQKSLSWMFHGFQGGSLELGTLAKLKVCFLLLFNFKVNCCGICVKLIFQCLQRIRLIWVADSCNQHLLETTSRYRINPGTWIKTTRNQTMYQQKAAKTNRHGVSLIPI